ncbi:hypothetical protein [Pseudoalteromonas obscura]|uniref:TMhelix containing protein n=1 Tax=Pseudoalteromonas obscura TaxID=3048491 RepID=A0ABT7EFF4_9GAMM|nr:hypothetical protein [Pseudoalteromonas sp. P94(2023)]MDK2594007.1 hypothetical protein [Pseudoalteromonas sp. P94(2023)]
MSLRHVERPKALEPMVTNRVCPVAKTGVNMEDVLSEIAKGVFRAIGYILADVFYGTVCYWIGWPICKLITAGEYPKDKQAVYFEGESSSGYWCSAIGLITIILVALYLIMQ